MVYLGSYRSRSGVSETEVEDLACIVGIYRVLRLFNVVDALRLAIPKLPAPSKPIIPSTLLTYYIMGALLCKALSRMKCVCEDARRRRGEEAKIWLR
jgi:hypothetical protein